MVEIEAAVAHYIPDKKDDTGLKMMCGT